MPCSIAGSARLGATNPCAKWWCGCPRAQGCPRHDNAGRVVGCGAGVRASKSASPAKLRRAIVGALQNPEIKRGARAIAQALARSDGAPTTAEIVEQLARPDAATPPPSCAAGGLSHQLLRAGADFANRESAPRAYPSVAN
jgi:hypothetical protein